MSLDYVLRKIKNHEELRDAEGKLSPESFAVVHYAGLITGIPDITVKNADEFYRRAHLWDTVIGPLQGTPGKPVDLHRETVQRHIGLTTNGGSKTSQEFMSHLRKEGFRVVLEKKRDALVEAVRKGRSRGPWAKPVPGRVYAVRFAGDGAPVLLTVDSNGAWAPYKLVKLPEGVPEGFGPTDVDEGPEDPMPIGVCALDVSLVADHCRTVDVFEPGAEEYFR